MGCGASSQANVGPVSRNSSAGSPLREKYQAFDVDGDGVVSKCDMHAKIFQDQEFQELLVDAGRLKAADDTEEALRIVDDVRNSKGTFDFDSFKKLTQKTSNRKLFEEIDVNGDGLISKAELSNKINRDYDVQERLHANSADGYQYVFEQFDLNGDRCISWEEFATVLAVDGRK
ncbi:hypothetical protein AB1Y20_011595 [Prymnesium parvum]|uniref:EF-hand domain-containing protein n=1 Tax=Prymnesium parvum TaxID=97485 RepID=A0AB34IGT2_PRYPA